MNRAAMPTKTLYLWIGIIFLTLLEGCGGGGTRARTDDGAAPTANALVASVALTASKLRVKSDNSEVSVITVTALDASNAAVPDATVVFATNTGAISSSTVVTDAQGSGTLNFSSGVSDPSTRTATVAASVNGKTAQAPVVITGSTVELAATGTTLPDDGSSTGTLVVTVKDAGGNPVIGASVSATAPPSGGGRVNIVTTPATTNQSGQVTFTVTGAVSGTTTVTVSALGETRTQAYTVSPTAAAFKIDLINGAPVPANHLVATTLGTQVPVRVNAPASTDVIFATTLGTWQTNGKSTDKVAVVAGKATATLNASVGGLASVQVLDPANSSQSDSVTLAVTAVTADRVSVQASPTVVARSSGATLGTSTLIATVLDSNGTPVGGVPVALAIVNPTGGGETITPVVGISAGTPTAELSLGQVKATFTSGSIPSGQQGVKIRASVVGVNVSTGSGTTPPTANSGFDASIVIGGVAASVSIGQAAQFTDTENQYIFPMSIVVTDANGNGVSGQTVNLSVFPIAFNTGKACVIDADSNTAPFKGTFFTEDFDENLSLGSTEDGRREFYNDGVRGSFAAATFSTAAGGGNTNNVLTPESSAAGAAPASVVTNANGTATFNLIYNKSSALHIVARVRASTTVQGTEAVGELKFRLPALEKDFKPPNICFLPDSPWTF
jgi:hypothetical protein